MFTHRLFTLAACAFGLSLVTSQGAIVWNESTDGDLSDNPAAPTTLTSKVATRSHTKRRPHNVGRTLRRRQLARHGASPAPTRPIPPTHPRAPHKNIVIIATDPAPRSPSFLFPQFMRVGAVAVGLGYGAVMGMFSGLVRSRSHAGYHSHGSPVRLSAEAPNG